MNRVKSFFSFLQDIFKSRTLLKTLAFNDIKMRYAGSVLGICWAFIQPLMTIFILWVVFQLGFRNPPVSDVPFILWIVAGYVPWFFFSDATVSSSASLFEYSYLVKKVKFRTSILPLVKVLSALIVHAFFIVFTILIYTIHSGEIRLIYFQSLYYSFALFFLLVGMAWLISSFSVFIKDLAQIVSVALQIGFWATPIVWNPEGMSPKVVSILKFNPLFYIVEGYRDSFIRGVPFYEHPYMTVYFWTIAVIVFLLGAISYQKLRPHFADVL